MLLTSRFPRLSSIVVSFKSKKMSVNIFEKVLRIIQVVVTLLEMALKSFTGLKETEEDSE